MVLCEAGGNNDGFDVSLNIKVSICQIQCSDSMITSQSVSC